jgi:hypothetical protein
MWITNFLKSRLKSRPAYGFKSLDEQNLLNKKSKTFALRLWIAKITRLSWERNL